MSEVNIEVLKKECKGLTDLITEANQTLAMKESAALKYAKAYGAANVAGALLGPVGFAAVFIIKSRAKSKAKDKAKDALLGLYQELIVKHQMIIDEQTSVLQELSDRVGKSEEELADLETKYETLSALSGRITAFISKAEA